MESQKKRTQELNQVQALLNINRPGVTVSENFPAALGRLISGLSSRGVGTEGFDDFLTLVRDRSQNEFDPYPLFDSFITAVHDIWASFHPNTESASYFEIDEEVWIDFWIPTSTGNFSVRPCLQQVMQIFSEIDLYPYGIRPASKSAVEGLPVIKITGDMLEANSSQCVVCKDSFELNMDVKQMPCKHIYHAHCILRWLELHYSCPLCRYELPTDNQDDENQRTGQLNDGDSHRRNTETSNLDLGAAGGSLESMDAGENNDPSVSRTGVTRIRVFLPQFLEGSDGASEGTGSNEGGADVVNETINRDSGADNPGSDGSHD